MGEVGAQRRVGVMPPQIFGDHRKHAFRICQHIIIPETQDAITLSLQKVSSDGVSFRGSVMLTAIDFNDQSRFMAHEVRYIPPDRHLPTKFVSLDLVRSQQLPNGPLGVGHIGPQYARPWMHAFSRVFLHLAHHNGSITPTRARRIKSGGRDLPHQGRG